MKNLIYIILILSTTTTIYSQNTKTLKLYLNFVSETPETEVLLFDGDEALRTEDQNRTSFGKFSPAITIQLGEKLRSEIELGNLLIQSDKKINLIDNNNRNIEGKTNNFHLTLRYELGYQLVSTNGLEIWGGAFIQPTFQSRKITPESEYLYTTKNSSSGSSIGIVPRLNYSFSDNLYLDVNIPISLLDWRVRKDSYESSIVPSAPIEESKSTSTAIPARFHFRIGLGVRL